MSRVLSKSMMSRVTPAELESLAMFYREPLQSAAHVLGRETKVYLGRQDTMGSFGVTITSRLIRTEESMSSGMESWMMCLPQHGGATVAASALPCLDVLMQQRKA